MDIMELKELRKKLHRTLNGPALPVSVVIDAVDILVREMQSGVYVDLLGDYDVGAYPERLSLTTKQLGSRTLLKRLEDELPPLRDTPELTRQRAPLGVLLHIAAGNTDVLPVFTVLEGLITGNINIVKLPSHDGGLTEKLVNILIHLEPRLDEYIYLVNAPSSDVETLKALAEMSNAVVVWGGNEAVRAIRCLTEPDTKISEWGHKLSFAYLSGDFLHWNLDEDLKGLARHIFRTRQLLTTSCQVVYLDTDDPQKQQQFCERFLPILENEFAIPPRREGDAALGDGLQIGALPADRLRRPGAGKFRPLRPRSREAPAQRRTRFGAVPLQRLPAYGGCAAGRRAAAGTADPRRRGPHHHPGQHVHLFRRRGARRRVPAGAVYEDRRHPKVNMYGKLSV